MITIETKQLYLHGMPPARLHELFETKSKEELVAYFGVDESDYAYFLNMHVKGMETFRISQFLFLIINKETRETMGEIGYHTLNNKHKRAELYYLLRDDTFKQHGYMTEAIKPVLKYGFETLNLHRIEAKVADWNIPSIKLLLRSGFTKEGTLTQDYFHEGAYHDSDCYVLLRHEWDGLKNED